MRPTRLLLVLALSTAFSLAFLCVVSPTPSATTCGESRALVPATDSPGAGMRIYLDPTTGQFSPEPVGPRPMEVPESLRNALSTSSQGLVSEESPYPGGGVMLRLGGRFQCAAVATVDEKGAVTTTFVTGAPDSPQKH